MNFKHQFMCSDNEDMAMIIHDDQLINDYEFEKRIYTVGLTERLQEYFQGKGYFYLEVI